MKTTIAVRRTPMSRFHGALDATMSVEAGWELPLEYADRTDHAATSIGIVDLTPRAKVDVRGALDEPLAVAANDLVARIAPDWALVLGQPGEEGWLVPRLEQVASSRAMVTDATHLLAGIGLIGPRLVDALARLTSWDPSTLPPGSATGAPIGEVRAVVVRRDLEVPMLEVYPAAEFARYAWATCAEVVARLGGGPVGWRALRRLGWR